MKKEWKVKTMEIRANIANGYYEPKRPYPPPPVKPCLIMDHTSGDAAKYASDLALYELKLETYKKHMIGYRAEERRLIEEFRTDAILDCGLQTSKARHTAFSMARDRGSSEGLGSVLDELEELTVLLDIAENGFE
jgi:hypothetical protein